MKTLPEYICLCQNFKTSEVKLFKFIPGEPSKIFYKNSYKDDDFSKVEITQKTMNLQNIILIKKIYRCRPKLKENKKRDLLRLVESNHIPNIYGIFYINL